MKNKGLLVVFSGPSGSGKGTLLKRYFEGHPEARYSISATTRAPRPGEEDGVAYYFVTKDAFHGMEEKGELLESAEFCGNCYGTPLKPIEAWLEEGFDVFLEIEVQGGAQVQKKVPESVGIFNLPPSMEELEKRLRGRGTEQEETIQKRLAAARAEIGEAVHYDYAVVNDDLDEAASAIAQILCAEKRKTARNKGLIERMLEQHD